MTTTDISIAVRETVAKLRADYTPMIKYSEAVEIFESLGSSRHFFRKARASGIIHGRRVTPDSNEYYLRDQVIQTMVGDQFDVTTIAPAKTH